MMRPVSLPVLLATTLALAILGPAAPARGGNASLVIGIQDHRLGIDTGLLPDLDPVGNDQTSVRATYTWDLSERLTVVAQGGAASSYLELTDQRLNGLTDFRLRALVRPTPEWAIGFGTIVPLGLYELTALEVTTAQWTWNPRSGFPLGLFGEGWGWEATVARGFSLGDDLTAGLAGAYLQHGEFSLLSEDLARYRLGAEASVSAALDWLPGPGRRVRGVAAMKFFGPDRLNDFDIVDQGNQLDLSLNVEAPVGSWATAWGAGVTLKGDNTFIIPEELAVVVDPDSLQLSQSPGTYLTFSGRVGRAAARGLHLYVEGIFTTIADSEYAIGSNGDYLSVGPGFGWRASPHFALGGRFSYIRGTGDFDLTFDGTDVLFTVEVRP